MYLSSSLPPTQTCKEPITYHETWIIYLKDATLYKEKCIIKQFLIVNISLYMTICYLIRNVGVGAWQQETSYYVCVSGPRRQMERSSATLWSFHALVIVYSTLLIKIRIPTSYSPVAIVCNNSIQSSKFNRLLDFWN